MFITIPLDTRLFLDCRARSGQPASNLTNVLHNSAFRPDLHHRPPGVDSLLGKTDIALHVKSTPTGESAIDVRAAHYTTEQRRCTLIDGNRAAVRRHTDFIKLGQSADDVLNGDDVVCARDYNHIAAADHVSGPGQPKAWHIHDDHVIAPGDEVQDCE